MELCNHYVSTDNVVKMYVKVLNGGGNEVAVGGNERNERRTKMNVIQIEDDG